MLLVRVFLPAKCFLFSGYTLTTGRLENAEAGRRPWILKKPNRRRFLNGGGGAGRAWLPGFGPRKARPRWTLPKKIDELIAYGDRSRFVTSIRKPVAERHSPDEFGLTFHVLTPLQDSFGIITPSSLFYTATHRGAFVPDLDPKEHRLMIHGMVDRPLVFNLDELKRLPYVSRIHFVECLGKQRARNAQNGSGVAWSHQLRRMDRCSAVPAAQRGRRSDRSIMDRRRRRGRSEGRVQYSIGESTGRLCRLLCDERRTASPAAGFPSALDGPGLWGCIYQIKYLRRIKVVDRYYMTYDDYGHINPDPKVAALTHQIGPKSVITFPSAGQQLLGPGFYEITGLAWSGAGAIRAVEISFDGGNSWTNAELRSQAHPMAHTRFGYHWNWDGKECMLMSRCTDELGTVQPDARRRGEILEPTTG